MNTTPYGYKNPQTGDRSKGASGWMASYNFNVLRGDNHSHNGIDSPQLNINSYATPSSTLSAASWVVSGNLYRQLVTVPAALTEINNFEVQFISPSGQRLHLGMVRVSATSFYVYCNDNTIDVTAIYR